jgi:serine/threonine-protein kinase
MIGFRLLGSVDLKGSEGETLRSVLAQPKRVALLAYLAVARPNAFHRRDKLLGLFWPESDQEHGRGALRKALYLLRQSLGEGVIDSRGDEEIGLAEGAVWCDTAAFEAALDAGEPEQALELYRGDLLEGFFIAEAPEFERWVEGERERLCSRASEAAWTLADEAAFRRLLELLNRLGDRTGAIKEYEAFARRSREEYEAEPSPETQALIAAIREREVSGVSGAAERPVGSPAGVQRAGAPESVPVIVPSDPHSEAQPVSLLRVLATYALVSLGVLVAVHIFTLQLGLPDWFFPSAVVVLLVCLPIIVATALVQGDTIAARRADRKAGEPSAIARRWLTWRNAVGVAVVAFAVLGLAVTGYMAMRMVGIGPWGTLIGKGVLDERDVIVLADFEDHTGDSILALTVTEGIRVRLEQSAVVRVAGDDHVGGVLQQMQRDSAAPLTGEVAREVAIRAGLKAVVAGEVNRAGSGYVLSSRLVAAETGETLASFLETAADADAILEAIDRLSAQLRERIGESLRALRNSPDLGEAWTASLEAARLFNQARLAGWQGDYTLAVDLFTRAIEIDTLFAQAYRRRAAYLVNLETLRAQRIGDIKRAYELRRQLPLTTQYGYEAAYHYHVTGDQEKLIAAYTAVLELDPGDSRSMNNLGMAYRGLRDYARAEEMFRRALEVNPQWGGG